METYLRSAHGIIKLAGALMIGVMVCLGAVAQGQPADDPGQRWEALNGQFRDCKLNWVNAHLRIAN